MGGSSCCSADSIISQELPQERGLYVRMFYAVPPSLHNKEQRVSPHNNEEEKKTHTPPRVPLRVRFLPRRAFLEQLKLKRFQQRVVVACACFGLALTIGIHRQRG